MTETNHSTATTFTSTLSRQQRYLGCLLGLATGDAVGTTLEFQPRGSFDPIDDMVGGGPFNLKPGQWTDDTSMALCLAHSLLELGFDANDQMRRYNDWRRNGYMSCTGRCFDIGVTVSEAINRYLKSGEPFAGSTNPLSAGNGSLMRLAPVVMYFTSTNNNSSDVIHFCGESARTTHGAKECVDATRYFGALLHLALNGADKNSILACDLYQPETRKVSAIQQQAYRDKTIAEIKGTGYVIDCLEASLWCFARTDNYRDAVLMAANLGDDADTSAAVCGQIAGAFYGVEGIPSDWLAKLAWRAQLEQLSLQLLTHSQAAGY